MLADGLFKQALMPLYRLRCSNASGIVERCVGAGRCIDSTLQSDFLRARIVLYSKTSLKILRIENFQLERS